jgi:RimJ/RimL family protein N-acetyltransferase
MAAASSESKPAELGAPLSPEACAATLQLPVKPSPAVLEGYSLRLEPFDEATPAAALYAVSCGAAALGHPRYDADALLWRYLLSAGLCGASSTEAATGAGAGSMPGAAVEGADPRLPYSVFLQHQRARSDAADRRIWVIRNMRDGAVVGQIGWLNNRPRDLVVEIGFVAITPALQATPTATEATYLLLRHAFALGYRRVEWKCNSANARSRAAAARIGFTHEGVFRQHMVVAGLDGVQRNRDTAWFSLLDGEWPERRAALEGWLSSPDAEACYARRRAQLAAMASDG